MSVLLTMCLSIDGVMKCTYASEQFGEVKC